MFIDVNAKFTSEAHLFHDDPKLFQSKSVLCKDAIMGDIVNLPSGEMSIDINVVAASPIERLDIYNGLNLIETFKPYSERDLGNRIRIIWEGAEYRGRFRQVHWDGEMNVKDNTILSSKPVSYTHLTLQTKAKV